MSSTPCVALWIRALVKRLARYTRSAALAECFACAVSSQGQTSTDCQKPRTRQNEHRQPQENQAGTCRHLGKPTKHRARCFGCGRMQLCATEAAERRGGIRCRRACRIGRVCATRCRIATRRARGVRSVRVRAGTRGARGIRAIRGVRITRAIAAARMGDGFDVDDDRILIHVRSLHSGVRNLNCIGKSEKPLNWHDSDNTPLPFRQMRAVFHFALAAPHAHHGLRQSRRSRTAAYACL